MSVERATDGDRPAIAKLIERAREQEDLELPLVADLDGLVYREGSHVVAFAGFEMGRVVEACAIVQPEHRRKGIGTVLLNALIAACREGQVEELYAVIDEASPSGKAFVEKTGARYTISEYRMELNRGRYEPRDWDDPLELEPVGADKLDLFVRTVAAGFEESEEGHRSWLAEDMRAPGRRFWIARKDGRPIGTARATGTTTDVYVTALSVVPNLRGRGYGRQILSRITELLTHEAWDRILIEVETENRNALGLYRSVGYDETRTYGFYRIAL